MSTWSSSQTCLLFPPNPEKEKFGTLFYLISPKPCLSSLRPCCLNHRTSFHWSRRGPRQLSILVGVIDYSGILSYKCSFVTLSPAESPVPTRPPQSESERPEFRRNTSSTCDGDYICQLSGQKDPESWENIISGRIWEGFLEEICFNSVG